MTSPTDLDRAQSYGDFVNNHLVCEIKSKSHGPWMLMFMVTAPDGKLQTSNVSWGRMHDRGMTAQAAAALVANLAEALRGEGVSRATVEAEAAHIHEKLQRGYK